jgi:hypothetical protein
LITVDAANQILWTAIVRDAEYASIIYIAGKRAFCLLRFLGAVAHSLFAPVPGAFSKTQSASLGGFPHFLLSSLKPMHRPLAKCL